MSTEDGFERQMQDIQKRIDEAERAIKEKAQTTLKQISDNYQERLNQKIAEELELAKQDLLKGNVKTAEQHKLRAEIYRSAIDSAKGIGGQQ